MDNPAPAAGSERFGDAARKRAWSVVRIAAGKCLEMAICGLIPTLLLSPQRIARTAAFTAVDPGSSLVSSSPDGGIY
jgi:hypothetical protein